MSDSTKNVEFSLKVMINKEKGKVLFAEADSHFVDILLSFLTLPLGRIIKLFEKQYGDESPSIGSLSCLYRSLAKLDNNSFLTEGAKKTLLNPTSSFEAEYERLKLDISSDHGRLSRAAAAAKGVFTSHRVSFVISDDLQILPNMAGMFQIFTVLGITDIDGAEPATVTIGLNEVSSLLKASFVSPTPLSDVILGKTVKTTAVGPEPKRLNETHEIEENPKSKKMVLKAIVHKSSGKCLYAQAEDDFVEFLFSLLHIPVGAAEHLVGGKIGIKAIDNLYRSATDLIDDKYFKRRGKKERLRNPNLPHGCVSKDHIFPLDEDFRHETAYDREFPTLLSSIRFPRGQGKYLDGPRTYQVTDDPTVTPFCLVSILSTLGDLKIPISDVKEVELEIGLNEALRILRASLTSPSALTHALLNQKSSSLNKKLKREV